MRIKLWQSILLALLVSAVSVLLYRLIDVSAYEQPLVVALPDPVRVESLPPHVPDVVEATPARPRAIEEMAISCGRCDRELANYRVNHGSLACRAALEACVKHRCNQSEPWAQSRFEDAINGFREHDHLRACAALLAVAAEARQDSIWKAKAEKLFSSRCDQPAQ